MNENSASKETSREKLRSGSGEWRAVYFFFSSRRRHTRLQGDWSSDVCSSDLSIDDIFADIYRVIVPGVTHWAHPQFMSYFGCTTTSPGILAEMIIGALNVNAIDRKSVV